MTTKLDDVILHQWEISPFCQKVRKALIFKGIQFNTVDYNGLLAGRVLKLSKVGKLPVLDHGTHRIQDSTTIVQYLDSHFPNTPPLYPVDPTEKALAEIWEDWADESLYFFEVYFRVFDDDAFDVLADYSTQNRPKYEKILLKPVLKQMLKLQVMMQGLGRLSQEEVERRFLQHLDNLELVLSSKPWLVGSEQTIADISVNAQLSEIYRTSETMRAEITKRQHLMAWFNLGQ